MRALLLAAIVFATLFSAGCVSTQVDSTELSQIKSMAIVANFNEPPVAKNVGTTVFQNAQYNLPPEAQDRNAAIEKQTAELLRDCGMTLVPVGAAREAFAAAKPSIDFWTGKDNTKIQPGLHALSTAGNPDAVLLIGTTSIQDPFTGTNQFFSNYGFYRRSYFMMEDWMVYVVISAGLYTRDGRALATRNAFATAAIPDVRWRSIEDPFTESELREMSIAIDEAFARALSDLLQKIGLLPDTSKG